MILESYTNNINFYSIIWQTASSLSEDQATTTEMTTASPLTPLTGDSVNVADKSTKQSVNNLLKIYIYTEYNIYISRIDWYFSDAPFTERQEKVKKIYVQMSACANYIICAGYTKITKCELGLGVEIL